MNDLTPEFDICELLLNLKRQKMLPTLLFHFFFELIALFRDLLAGVERKQKEAYPTFSAPHLDFVFNPGSPISSDDFVKICQEVKTRDCFNGDFCKHILMRALQREIGIFINNHHFNAYRLVVMRFAMQGRLGVVFSDSSMACLFNHASSLVN